LPCQVACTIYAIHPRASQNYFLGNNGKKTFLLKTPTPPLEQNVKLLASEENFRKTFLSQQKLFLFPVVAFSFLRDCQEVFPYMEIFRFSRSYKAAAKERENDEEGEKLFSPKLFLKH
jgi:hypothetical protein